MALFQSKLLTATTALTRPTAKWSKELHSLVYSKKIGRDWVDTPIEQPFLIDIWRMEKGYEWYVDPVVEGGKKKRATLLVPMSDEDPEAPLVGGLRAIFVLPIYSREIGGPRDLILDSSQEILGQINVMCESIVGAAVEMEEREEYGVPLCTCVAEQTPILAVVPAFEVSQDGDDWVDRPDEFGPITVSFTA